MEAIHDSCPATTQRSDCAMLNSTQHNLMEMLCRDLKGAKHKAVLQNHSELKKCCKDEQAKIPSQQCEKTLNWKWLLQLIADTDACTSYWITPVFIFLVN